MSKLLPIILIVLGIAAGGGSGFFLRPAPVIAEGDEESSEHKSSKEAHKEPEEAPAFVKLNNQFVVPIVSSENVSALVVLSITLETYEAATEQLYNLEPKIRDTGLRVLFDHAYSGGFDGHFTAPSKLDTLRKSLLEAINSMANGAVTDVLITDIIRQDT
ncbi:flagellar basal body-associated FliL family protein [Litoreibacter sp.]|nr:flagellar basal body-associated FliL family protein [Litoreibacter sp.]